MLILLFDSVCLLVFIAAFMGEDSVSYSYTYRLFMQSTPFSNYLFLMFQLKDCLTNIGQHLRSKHWRQLDNVLTNKSAKPYVTVTKVNREENCFTDYRLLILSVSSPLRARRELQDLPRS